MWNMYQMVRETCKNTKICFQNLKVIARYWRKGKKTNTHLENYCKQQNLDFFDNSNIKKSDLNSRGLHLQERGSSELAKYFLDYFYWVCATGNCFTDHYEQSKFCIVKELRNNKLSHPKYVSLLYLNINSIRNTFLI